MTQQTIPPPAACWPPVTADTVFAYSFAVWPDETSGRMAAAPAVFDLFRVARPRVVMEFTERGFGDFREELARVGMTVREVERVPHLAPEPVA